MLAENAALKIGHDLGEANAAVDKASEREAMLGLTGMLVPGNR